MRLLLLRHGQTPANVLGSLDTAVPGPGLTRLGLTQASAVPSALEDERIDGIWVSTLVRTAITAAPIAASRNLDPVVVAGLREISAGSLEDRTDHRSQMTYLETAFAWADGARDVVMPGGPDGHEFFGRFDAGIAEVTGTLGPDGVALVVSHGMAIRTWVAGTAINVDGAYVAKHQLGNTGLVVLETTEDDHGWTMREWLGAPIGGALLEDEAAEDPTGESIQEARRNLGG